MKIKEETLSSDSLRYIGLQERDLEPPPHTSVFISRNEQNNTTSSPVRNTSTTHTNTRKSECAHKRIRPALANPVVDGVKLILDVRTLIKETARPSVNTLHSRLRNKGIEQLHVITGELLRIYPTVEAAAAFMRVPYSSFSECFTKQTLGFNWKYFVCDATINCKLHFFYPNNDTVWCVYLPPV